MQYTSRYFFMLHAVVALHFIIGCAPTTRFPSVDSGVAEIEARKQRLVAMRSELRHAKRLYDVAFSVAASNAELCGKKLAYRFGAVLPTLEDYSREWRDLAMSEFGIGKELTVTSIVPDSPAEKAGFSVGDRIVKMNGKTLATGKRAHKLLSSRMGKHDGGEMVLGIRRNGVEQDIPVIPVLSCSYPVHLVHSDSVNAWADGNAVYITSGMLRFVENDDELALIIGHELAHNTRNHMASKRGNILLGALIGAAISGVSGVNVTDIGTQAGAAAFSQEFEAEADYVGVYHAARAGFDVTKAADLWRRIGTSNPAAINLEGTTHPSTAKRYLAVEMGMREVARKQASGLPLVPEERSQEQ